MRRDEKKIQGGNGGVLRRLFGYAVGTVLLRCDFDWLRIWLAED
jgi:hypothetical protein